MKTLLFAVVIQLVASPEEGKPPLPEVKATFTAELGSMEACTNASLGIRRMGELSGYVTNVICAPYDIGKLEVEKPPKAPAKLVPGSSQAQL